ncbi:hypothetical protein AB6H12_15050 [Proteus mirabilis]|uniref:hypothetical protein n=1 Tax=Proteus mirabilis TaxID=584 RepID=UPI0034DD7DFD
MTLMKTIWRHNKPNTASGLGVALFNDEGEIIIPNKFNKYKFIEENELKLKFKASYLATKKTLSVEKLTA